VFTTTDPNPECGSCGSTMTIDPDSFDDAIERIELDGAEKANRELRNDPALADRWRNLTAAQRSGDSDLKHAQAYLDVTWNHLVLTDPNPASWDEQIDFLEAAIVQDLAEGRIFFPKFPAKLVGFPDIPAQAVEPQHVISAPAVTLSGHSSPVAARGPRR
jgi:hypothetical protein